MKVIIVDYQTHEALRKAIEYLDTEFKDLTGGWASRRNKLRKILEAGTDGIKHEGTLERVRDKGNVRRTSNRLPR
jgi:hypothetical protein